MPSRPVTSDGRIPTRLLLLLAALSVFGPISMDLYLPSLPELAADLGTTDQLAQLTMSVCMVGLGVGQLVAGPLSDRLGRRLPLLVGVAGYAVLSVACALAPTIELLLVARALQGLAGSAGIVVAMAVARDLVAGPHLSRTLSLLASVTVLAPVLAPVAGAQLARVMDWRGIFGVLAGIGVLQLAAAARWLPETRPAGSATHPHEPLLHSWRALLGDPVLRGVLLGAAFTSVGFFSYLSMSSFALQQDLGASAQTFSLLFATNALTGMLGAQVSRRLVLRLAPAQVYVIGLVGWATTTAVLALLATRGAGLPVLAVGLALGQGCLGLVQPNAPAIALAGHAQRAGAAAALLGTVGMSVGPVVVPLVLRGTIDAELMTRGMATGAALAAVTAVVLVVPRTRQRREAGPDPA